MSDYEYSLKKKEELKIMMLKLKNNRLESSKLFSLSPLTFNREKWSQNMKKKKRLQKKIAMHYGEQKVWERKIFEIDEEDVLFCKKINRIYIKNKIYIKRAIRQTVSNGLTKHNNEYVKRKRARKRY